MTVDKWLGGLSVENREIAAEDREPESNRSPDHQDRVEGRHGQSSLGYGGPDGRFGDRYWHFAHDTAPSRLYGRRPRQLRGRADRCPSKGSCELVLGRN